MQHQIGFKDNQERQELATGAPNADDTHLQKSQQSQHAADPHISVWSVNEPLEVQSIQYHTVTPPFLTGTNTHFTTGLSLKIKQVGLQLLELLLCRRKHIHLFHLLFEKQLLYFYKPSAPASDCGLPLLKQKYLLTA